MDAESANADHVLGSFLPSETQTQSWTAFLSVGLVGSVFGLLAGSVADVQPAAVRTWGSSLFGASYSIFELLMIILLLLALALHVNIISIAPAPTQNRHHEHESSIVSKTGTQISIPNNLGTSAENNKSTGTLQSSGFEIPIKELSSGSGINSLEAVQEEPLSDMSTLSSEGSSLSLAINPNRSSESSIDSLPPVSPSSLQSRPRSWSAPASSLRRRRKNKDSLDHRKQKMTGLSLDGGDLAVTELGLCVEILRNINPQTEKPKEIKNSLATVISRLESGLVGDDITMPVMKVNVEGSKHDNPFSEGLIRAAGLKEQPKRHVRSSSQGGSHENGKQLYAPISRDSFQEESYGSIPFRSASDTQRLEDVLLDSWNRSPWFGRLQIPKSPIGNGLISIPKWQQAMHTVIVDSVALASWDFDPFKATNVDPANFGQDVMDDHTVSAVPFVLRMLADHGIFADLEVEPDCMKRYLRRVEREYQKNPYHNRVHGFDVMQTCHCVLIQSPALKAALSPIEKLALLLGAFVHDVGHPGVNNKLLAKLADESDWHDSREPKVKERCRQLAQYAVTYNSKSILESFHISRAFQVAFDMREKDANPFCKLENDDFSKLRSLMVQLVLATDMENHFIMVNKMKHLAADASGKPVLLDLNDATEKETLLKAIIHACDVGNPTKQVDMACKWTSVISEEFWAQGEFERELGFTPERMLERQDTTTKGGRYAQAQGQIAFIKFIVKPLHEVLATQLPIFRDVSMKNLNDVVKYWEGVLEENAES